MWAIKHEGLHWRIVVVDHKLRTQLPEEGKQQQGRHSPSPAVVVCT